MSDIFEFEDKARVERLVGTLHDPGATPGDVLTVQANGSVAAAAGGGSMPGLTVADFLFTEQATGGPTLAITAVDQAGAGSFSVAGDETAHFPAGSPFTVNGSTGNDGNYVTTSAAFTGGHTVIVADRAPADATADGTILAPGLYVATFPCPAGTAIADVQLIAQSGAWAADSAKFSMDDVLSGSRSYFSALNLVNSFTDGPMTPDNIQFGGNFANLVSNGSDYDTGQPWFNGSEPAAGGPGVFYADDDELTMRIDTQVAAPPVVPVGLLLVRILYVPPVTPTAASFA